MKAGDTFSIELPEELRGYTGTIYLKNESGEVFGTCLGTGSIVTCTFSDLVEKRDNISGFFYIESQINSMEQQGEIEVQLIFVIDGVTITDTIIIDTGVVGEPGENDRLFGKFGSINEKDPKLIDWVLEINGKGDLLGPTVITDVVKSGHEFVEGSLSLYKNGDWIETGFVSSKSGFELNLYINAGETYLAYYQTKITDSSQTSWSNEATMKAWGKEPFVENIEVKEFSSGGGADGDLKNYSGILKIIKIDETNEKIFLAGAIFELINNEGNVVKTLITDENGEAETDEIPGGIYTLKEITAPEGYEILSESQEIRLDFKEINNIEKIISNKKIVEPTGSFHILKVNEDYKDYQFYRVINNAKTEENLPVGVLAGAKFAIYSEYGELVKEGITDEGGNLSFEDLPYGKYTYREIQAPEGYLLDETMYEITINEYNSNVFVRRINQRILEEPWIPIDPIKGSIKITKVDKNDDNILLSGAEFELTVISEHNIDIVYNGTTDVNGVLEFKDLPYGRYTLTETKAPEGYVIDVEIQELIIAQGQAVEIIVENSKFEPEKPVEPEKPEEPEEPVEPEYPEDPEEPVEPEYPEDPEGPEEPEKPVEPENLEDPEEPEELEKPLEPIVPEVVEPQIPEDEFENIDEDIPGERPDDEDDKPKLPNTGAFSPMVLYGLGGLSLLIGTILRKKED